MTKTRQAIGQRGERLAADKLSQLGYTIVERNFRCAEGELDLVTRLGPTWVFVEVRTRRGRRFGSPEESITPRKRTHLIRSAQGFLQSRGLLDVDWRIDLVAVEFDSRGRLLRVDITENAVNNQ